eukprot:gb/GEZN01012712.1/.p1 GENE.gb/GEZN01012712.1/~~gb/GEZN01012712.1/.p1  ORF type:complete len:207 (+),score=17.81 gb/GEZN01012712.1/:104-724(+)
MKVVCVGAPRTGTLSLRLALEQLGLKSFHMRDLLRCKTDLAAWAEGLRSFRRDGDRAAVLSLLRKLDGYDALVGWPVTYFLTELRALFPAAVYILTTRDDASWLFSWKNLMAVAYHPELNLPQAVLGNATAEMLTLSPLSPVASLTAYRAYNQRVLAELVKERLLVFGVGHGWAPLCDFLGFPIPDRPYPKLNTSSSVSSRYRSKL